MQSGDFKAALEPLTRVERLNPKQRGLWEAYALLFAIQQQFDKALDAYKKELLNYPDGGAPDGAEEHDAR